MYVVGLRISVRLTKDTPKGKTDDRPIFFLHQFVKKYWKTTPKTTGPKAIEGKRKHPSPTKVPRKKKVIVIDDSDDD
jgi:hypothetical protein